MPHAQEHAAGTHLRHPHRRQRELVRRPVLPDLLALERLLPRSAGGSQTTAYLVAVAGALGYFASLILHELGHALVARRLGIPIVGIDLWFFGGLSQMRREPASAGEELKIAAAGPAVTLALFVLCLARDRRARAAAARVTDVALARARRQHDARARAARLARLHQRGAVRVQRRPRLPARRRARSPARSSGGAPATATAPRRRRDARGRPSRCSSALFGLWAFAGSDSFARAADDAARVLPLPGRRRSRACRARSAGASSTSRSATSWTASRSRSPPTSTLLDAQEQFFLRYRWPWFAVVDPARHFLGVVRQQRVESEIAAGRPALPVVDVLEEDLPVRIGEEAPLESLLGSEGLGRLGRDGRGRRATACCRASSRSRRCARRCARPHRRGRD